MADTTLKILLVDDEDKFLNSIARRLRLMGFDPLLASNGPQALELARSKRIDMAIVDLKMPGMDGLVTITKLKEKHPDLRSVLLTGHGSEKVKQATEALKADYFEKDQMDAFWNFVKRSGESGNTVIIRPPAASRATGDVDRHDILSASTIEVMPDRRLAANRPAPSGADSKIRGTYFGERLRMVGETPAMQELRRDIERLAALDCSVIISGETGTGKELAARMIHASSARKNSEFVAINCGCFSNDLMIEEFFRHGRTTLPGDVRPGGEVTGSRPGGTILLDQIEGMSPRMQLSMLKLIDSKNISRPAGASDFPLDVRIMAASCHDLGNLVEEGKFRDELYYRLNVLELFIPPLRERKDDIQPLSSYFIHKFAEEFGKSVVYISEEVVSAFMSYDFPGNVRELEHIIERAVILADGSTIEFKHLPRRFHKAESAAPESAKAFTTLAEMEKNYILEVLEATDGNKTKATEVLGISRAALWRKLKQFEKEKEQKAPVRKDGRRQ